MDTLIFSDAHNCVLTPFVQIQFELFKTVLDYINPKIIIVANALASHIITKNIQPIPNPILGMFFL